MRRLPAGAFFRIYLRRLAVPMLLNWLSWGMAELTKTDPAAQTDVVASFQIQAQYFDERIARAEIVYATGSFAKATRERFGKLMSLISLAAFWLLPVLRAFPARPVAAHLGPAQGSRGCSDVLRGTAALGAGARRKHCTPQLQNGE